MNGVQGDLIDQYYKGEISLRKILETLAPGTPQFSKKRSHNPIAYHKYTSGGYYTFYIMEYMIFDNDFISFWGYEIDVDPGMDINLCSWYRLLGMMMIVGAKMKRDSDFKPTYASDIPQIGKEWLSKRHDNKRDHLAADYARKYYKAQADNKFELMQDLNTLYEHRGEKLDRQYSRKIRKN